VRGDRVEIVVDAGNEVRTASSRSSRVLVNTHEFDTAELNASFYRWPRRHVRRPATVTR